MSGYWDKYMGPLPYRLAIVITSAGAVLVSVSVMCLIEMANGDIDVTYGPVGKILILSGMLIGLALFVIGCVDGSARELQHLAEKEKDEH